jgi:hypothetical protein
MSKAETQVQEMPYPPSWIDRLIQWVDAMPGPAWGVYLVLLSGTVLLIVVTFWIDGAVPWGDFEPITVVFALFAFYWLWCYHYLSTIGSKALLAFRPLLDASDKEAERIDYKIRTLPRREGRLSVLVGTLIAGAVILSDPEPYGSLTPKTFLPAIANSAGTMFMVVIFIGFVVRSVRQLRLVRQLHARATRIDLMHLAPAHAFSGLTARTGIVFLLIVFLGIVGDPAQSASGINLILTVGVAVLSVGVFVLPIVGIQDHLEHEKNRVLGEINELLAMAVGRLHVRVRGAEYSGMQQAEAAIAALIRERDLVSKVSTWPWDPRTVRGFASAMLLPLFLWVVTRLLERLL